MVELAVSQRLRFEVHQVMASPPLVSDRVVVSQEKSTGWIYRLPFAEMTIFSSTQPAGMAAARSALRPIIKAVSSWALISMTSSAGALGLLGVR
jgi:hypothetical protein